MSLIYMPENILLHKLCVDVSCENQEYFLKSDMNFGTHTRIKGTPTVKLLNVTLQVYPENQFDFESFVDAVGPLCFYSTYPDAMSKTYDRNKYYCFSFDDERVSVNKITRLTYSTMWSLFWHYRIPPMWRT